MKKVIALEFKELVAMDNRIGALSKADRANSSETAQIYALLLDFAEKKGWRFIQNDHGPYHNKYIFQTNETI